MILLSHLLIDINSTTHVGHRLFFIDPATQFIARQTIKLTSGRVYHIRGRSVFIMLHRLPSKVLLWSSVSELHVFSVYYHEYVEYDTCAGIDSEPDLPVLAVT